MAARQAKAIVTAAIAGMASRQKEWAKMIKSVSSSSIRQESSHVSLTGMLT